MLKRTHCFSVPSEVPISPAWILDADDLRAAWEGRTRRA